MKELFCRAGKHSLDRLRWGKSLVRSGFKPKRGQALVCPECAREHYDRLAKIRATKYK